MPAPRSKGDSSVHMQGVVKNRRKALAASGRGTCEELGIPVSNGRALFSHQHWSANLYQENRGRSGHNRSRRVHRDAKRAMVGSRFIRVDVCHLGNCKQRQQHETQERDHAQGSGLREPGPGACVCADLGSESCQKPSPALRIQVIGRKITKNGWPTSPAQAAKRPANRLPTRLETHLRSGRLNCVR